MHILTITQEINVPATRVWQALDDFGNIANFHPYVKESSIINGIETGMGARRVCHFYDGNSIKETIVRYEPEKGYSVTMEEFSLPLKQGLIHLDVFPVNEHRSRVSVRMEFEPKFGLLGWLMATVMIKPMLKSRLKEVFPALETHIITGKVIGENGDLLSTLEKVS